MDQHYKPLFEELTKEENFKKLMDLRSFYDDVLKPEIILEFWKAVENKIKEEIQNREELKGWKSQFLEEAIIYFYKTDWVTNKSDDSDPVPFSIVWRQLNGKPFYGVLIDKRILSKYNEIRDLNPKINIDGISLKFSDTNYIAWNYYNESLNFQAQNSLFDILPSKRDDKIYEFAKILIDLGKGYESHIDNLIQTYNFKFQGN